MGNPLRIEFKGRILWEGEVDEFSWTENDSGVTAKGTLRGARRPPAGGGFLDMLTRPRPAAIEPEPVATHGDAVITLA